MNSRTIQYRNPTWKKCLNAVLSKVQFLSDAPYVVKDTVHIMRISKTITAESHKYKIGKIG